MRPNRELWRRRKGKRMEVEKTSMVDLPNSSSSSASRNGKPVVVRLKRKRAHSPLDAFWLEVNEGSRKKAVLDMQKLSINSESDEGGGCLSEEPISKRVLLCHVETVMNFEDTANFLRSGLQGSTDASVSGKSASDRTKSFKQEKDQPKYARFEQSRSSHRGRNQESLDDPLQNCCQLYDVIRVDDEEMPEIPLQDQPKVASSEVDLLMSYLPLLMEYLPSAAEELKADINAISSEDYVYDLYAVDNDIYTTSIDASTEYPLIQVEDDEFYEDPSHSDYDSDDSNAEDNPLNEYPEESAESEELSDDESVQSEDSLDHTEDEDDDAFHEDLEH